MSELKGKTLAEICDELERENNLKSLIEASQTIYEFAKHQILNNKPPIKRIIKFSSSEKCCNEFVYSDVVSKYIKGSQLEVLKHKVNQIDISLNLSLEKMHVCNCYDDECCCSKVDVLIVKW